MFSKVCAQRLLNRFNLCSRALCGALVLVASVPDHCLYTFNLYTVLNVKIMQIILKSYLCIAHMEVLRCLLKLHDKSLASAVPSGKHVCEMYTPHTPLLYSKTGVIRGIHIFLIFDPKHRLWVLVRTASARWF